MPNTKVTKNTTRYPKGFEPDYIVPAESADFRYIIGKKGAAPLVALCMNPSAAGLDISDRTVNRVIAAAQTLRYDGWYVINIYPERSTDAQNMESLDKSLVEQNVHEARKLLRSLQAEEVWGAWGEPRHKNLIEGRNGILQMLKDEGIRIFSFNVNKSGNPTHPLYLKIDLAKKVEVDVSRLLHLNS